VYDTVIVTEMENIREQLEGHEESVDAFMDYVERTWLGRFIRGTRKRPLFPIPTWNHHVTLQQGKCKTSQNLLT
jgi:hypothetical protein